MLPKEKFFITTLQNSKFVSFTETTAGSMTFTRQVEDNENLGDLACVSDEKTGNICCAGVPEDGRILDVFNMAKDENLFFRRSSTAVQNAKIGVQGDTTEQELSVSFNSEKGEFLALASVIDSSRIDKLKLFTFNMNFSLVKLTEIHDQPVSPPIVDRNTAVLARGNNTWTAWSNSQTNVFNVTVCNSQGCIDCPLWHHPSDFPWPHVPVGLVRGLGEDDVIALTAIPNTLDPIGGAELMGWNVDDEGNVIFLKGDHPQGPWMDSPVVAMLRRETFDVAPLPIDDLPPPLLLSTSSPTPAVSSCFPLGSLPLLFNSLSSGEDRAWSQIWWAPIPLRAKRFLA